MGWKWFRLMRAPTSAAPAASALGEGAPYYDTTTKRLRISDGANWSDDTFQPGMMIEFAGSSAPAGWIICDGSAISRTTYAKLFTAIGTTWGVGNGTTTFNIPDHRAAAGAGVGTSTGYTQNETLALAVKYNDQIHGHWHELWLVSDSANGTVGATYSDSGRSGGSGSANRRQTGNDYVRAPISDGTNGTPRTGNVTRGKLLGVNFIIKF
jgi:microcystin-dependent protein